MFASLFERFAGVVRRLIRPAPEPPAYWNAWARLDELEAFVRTEKEETMAQIDDLRAVAARQTAVINGLMEMVARVRSVNEDLAGQLAALSPADPAAVQATIDAATAAADAGEVALAPAEPVP